jgi:hypothetical protein
MLLENINPIVIPATEAKTFPNFWVTRIIMDTPSPTEGRVFIELKPYNAITKEILNSPERINIQDFWQKSELVPEIPAAIEAILAAVNAIKDN